jgi:MFS transporter, DHA2 family, multidrug resistance protein
MMRQLGGAIGIAIINIYLTNVQAEAHANMVQHISEYNSLNTDRIAAYTQNFTAQGFAVNDAASAANQVMSMNLLRQEQLIGYTHGFLMVGFGILLCIPFVFLIKYKKPKPGVKAPAVDAH